jgi:hypothetical protein
LPEAKLQPRFRAKAWLPFKNVKLMFFFMINLSALSFGVIVIGGAFVVKYVGTMVLQVSKRNKLTLYITG